MAFGAVPGAEGIGVQVQHHRQVFIPADVDFINGNLFQMFELGSGIMLLQMPPLNLLDRVPADLQVRRDGRDGHVP